MVLINKSGTDQRIPLRKLTLYNLAPQHVRRHSKFTADPPYRMEKAVPGPSNIREAEDYKTKLDELFEEFTTMLRNDDKEALETTIKNVKRHFQGTWGGHDRCTGGCHCPYDQRSGVHSC